MDGIFAKLIDKHDDKIRICGRFRFASRDESDPGK
jgi:hypothetical protein